MSTATSSSKLLPAVLLAVGLASADAAAGQAMPDTENGRYALSPVTDGVMRLTSAQLAALIDGMDWSRLHARDVTRPTATS